MLTYITSIRIKDQKMWFGFINVFPTFFRLHGYYVSPVTYAPLRKNHKKRAHHWGPFNNYSLTATGHFPTLCVIPFILGFAEKFFPGFHGIFRMMHSHMCHIRIITWYAYEQTDKLLSVAENCNYSFQHWFPPLWRPWYIRRFM